MKMLNKQLTGDYWWYDKSTHSVMARKYQEGAQPEPICVMSDWLDECDVNGELFAAAPLLLEYFTWTSGFVFGGQGVSRSVMANLPSFFPEPKGEHDE